MASSIKGSDGPEPVAIVGMACRLPGESSTTDAFWQLLVDKRSGYSEPPANRYNIDGFYDPKSKTGTLGLKGGYFVSEPFMFDPPFFGITQTEAMAMDPQQRKLLECVYEAFEAGGITLDSVSGKNVGAYIGNFTYDTMITALRDMEYPKPYSMTGNGATILSNRVSYVFNLCGPSLTIDTACSSSLYAVHLACRALQSGEIDGAVAGGTNMILDAAVQIATDKMGVLSHTSTCHTFDAAADGYGRAEGVGAIYLKRLCDAVRDGDPIRGIIRGTAVNANGKTSGITQPSAAGQASAARAAYAFAGGLSTDETSYFETHGTGTPVGDPIELNGITDLFLKNSTRDTLLVGAVKTNVGHSEAASAMASIIKVVLAMEKGTIPATIGIERFNPNIDFWGGRLKVVTDAIEWPTTPTTPTGHAVRRSSLNSFGYGGANAHAIIESAESYSPGLKSTFKRRYATPKAITQAPAPTAAGRNTSSATLNVQERRQFLLPFSAADFPSLKATVEKHKEVASHYDLLDLAFTLGTRRSFFFNRGYAIASVDTIEDDLDSEDMTFGKRGNGANIAFIFTGQGAQTAQMGKELMESFPSYLQSIRDMDLVLQSLGEDAPTWTIEDVLLEPKATSAIDQVHLSQPLCTAVQIALVKLLRLWGVQPVATVGHSSGEIAAAYAAGAMTETQAILAAYFRGVAVGKLTTQGTMLAVGLGADEVETYLEEGLRIACYNSPQSVTLSGDADVAARVQAKLDADKVFVRAVRTSGRAYHSHHMKQVGGIYEEHATRGFARLDALAALNHVPAKSSQSQSQSQSQGVPVPHPNPTFVSSVTGEPMLDGFQPGPEYWRQNLESPVKFTQALTRAIESKELGINHIIEIGPHTALAGPIRQIREKLGLNSRDLEYTGTLARGENSITRLLDLAGSLFIKGYPVDLGRVNAIEEVNPKSGSMTVRKGLPLVDLPKYSWNYTAGELRNTHRLHKEFQYREFPRHDLLGSHLPGTIRDQAQFRNMLDIKDLPWLEQHKLGTQPVLPATGYLAIAVEAARRFFHGKVKMEGAFKYFFPHVTIKAALNLTPAGTPTELMTSVRFQLISNAAASKEWLDFTISSVVDGHWTEHVVGVIGRQPLDVPAPLFDETKVQELRTPHTWYRGFANVGLNYGAAFNGLSNIRTDPWGQFCVADTKLAPLDVPADDSRYLVHPGTMDTILQAVMIGAHQGSLIEMTRSFVPVDLEGVSIYSYQGVDMPAPPAADSTARILAWGKRTSLRALDGGFQLWGPDGRPLMDVKHAHTITYAEGLDQNSLEDRHPYLRVVWKPDVETLEPGNKLPAAARDHRRPLSAEEHAVLASYAQRLLTVARSSTAAFAAAVIEALSASGISVDETLAEAGDSADYVGADLSEAEGQSAFGSLGAIYDDLMLAFASNSPPEPIDPRPLEDSLTETLDLVAHKFPGMKILQVVKTDADLARKLPLFLEGDSSLKRYKSFTYLAATDALVEAAAGALAEGRDVSAEKSTLLEDGSIGAGALEGSSFDLVILTDVSPSGGTTTADVLKLLTPLLSDKGRILIHHSNHQQHLDAAFKTDFWKVLDLIARELGPDHTKKPDASLSSWMSALDTMQLGLRVIDQTASGWTLLSEPLHTARPVQDIVVLSREAATDAAQDQERSTEAAAFFAELAQSGHSVSHAFLSDENFKPRADAIYVSIVELGSSLFYGNLNATEFANLQSLAEAAQAIFWLTSGDLLGKVDPNAAIVQGLGRALQTENVLLTFVVIDFDHSDARRAARQTVRVLDQYTNETDLTDKEYIVKDDVFHVSRLAQDANLDTQYGEIIRREAEENKAAYDPTEPIHLDIEAIGLLDTLHFKADERSRALGDGEAEVEIKAVGINMKDYATFRGTFHSESLSNEGSGVVLRVGAGVTNVQVGDRVCFLEKGLFGNIERFRAMHLHRIPEPFTFEDTAGMPLVFTTALYGLLHLGRLKKGEKVLIHSATGGVGLAAIQIAQMAGAEIFATVGTPDKREYLVREHGIQESHIFNSRDTSFAAGILAATDGYGIDVALNSLVRERLAASWSVMAPSGRHIEIGRTDIMEFGSLDMNGFKRNTTFSAFDIWTLGEDHPETVVTIMKDVVRLLGEGKIRPVQPLAVFPAARIREAFKEFGNADRIGKVVVSFESDTALAIKREPQDAIKFRPDGTYLLIGCLGGLGRCLARFMVERGARHLTFIGRSGADKPEAATMVDQLRARGCAVHVVRGDVTNEEDVKEAVAAAGVPVYGMVQGAMALEDKLFSKLDLAGWNYPIDPKVRGTWNLHKALAGQPLDFFVMLSSISAMTGAPTQSNYCSANTFLDFFSRYRAAQGLPATTVGLTMVLEVGYVSQDLRLEQGVARFGVHGLSELDFLMLMEQAMKPGRVGDWRLDPEARHYLVTGLEPAKLAANVDMNGFRFWRQPRVGPLLTAIQRKSEGSSGHGAGGKQVLDLEGVLEATVAQFAKTFMVPVEDVDPTKPLVSYGMDSMIGTALRNWCYSTFKVDVPASDFMGPVLTAKSLAEKIFAGVS